MFDIDDELDEVKVMDELFGNGWLETNTLEQEGFSDVKSLNDWSKQPLQHILNSFQITTYQRASIETLMLKTL